MVRAKCFGGAGVKMVGNYYPVSVIKVNYNIDVITLSQSSCKQMQIRISSLIKQMPLGISIPQIGP